MTYWSYIMFLGERGSLAQLPTYVELMDQKMENMEFFCMMRKLEAMEKWLSTTEFVNSIINIVSDMFNVA